MTADTNGFTPHGKHLIAGEWVAGETTFENEPTTGRRDTFSVGTPAHVDTAAAAAEDAFWTYGYSTRAERAAFLNAGALMPPCPTVSPHRAPKSG